MISETVFAAGSPLKPASASLFSFALISGSALKNSLVAFFAFCFMIFYGVKTIVYGEQVRGFTTLIVVILFMGGVQLMTIGVLGEYIGRIFNETKKRPTYLASEYNENEVY